MTALRLLQSSLLFIVGRAQNQAAPPSCDTINGNVSGTILTFNATLPPGQHCQCGTNICNPGDITCDANTNTCTASRTIPVRLYLGQEFVRKFPSDHITKANAVLMEVRKLFELPSLGAKFQLIHEDPIIAGNDLWKNNLAVDADFDERRQTAEADLDVLRQMAAAEFPTGALVYLNSRPQGVTSFWGASYLRSMCDSHTRGSLVTWREAAGNISAVQSTALEMAHEIAHTLGVRHDFYEVNRRTQRHGRHHLGRLDRNRTPCGPGNLFVFEIHESSHGVPHPQVQNTDPTKDSHIMNYPKLAERNESRWSACTAEHLRRSLENNRRWTRCLEAPVQVNEECDQLGRGWKMCDTGLTCDASTSPSKCQVNNAR